MQEQRQYLAPGRYAAIDVGTNSTLLLVADVDEAGLLRPVVEEARITRLGQGFYRGGALGRAPRQRTLDAICDYVELAQDHQVDWIALVGTAALREASNGPAFCDQVRRACGTPIEVITGEQEAELTYRGNLYAPHLPPTEATLACLDLGGGSTELTQGVGERLVSRVSYDVGAVRITEQCFTNDPPTSWEITEAERVIETVLGEVEPLPPGAVLVGAGGTIVNLASVALSSGMVACGEVHGTRLTHGLVTELVDLFASLPVVFRKRVPGLEPERADVILAGAMILHQMMARLSAPRVVASTRGVRHGCVYRLAARVPSLP